MHGYIEIPTDKTEIREPDVAIENEAIDEMVETVRSWRRRQTEAVPSIEDEISKININLNITLNISENTDPNWIRKTLKTIKDELGSNQSHFTDLSDDISSEEE